MIGDEDETPPNEDRTVFMPATPPAGAEITVDHLAEGSVTVTPKARSDF